MAEARQAVGLKLQVQPDGKIEIDWSSGNRILLANLNVEELPEMLHCAIIFNTTLLFFQIKVLKE